MLLFPYGWLVFDWLLEWETGEMWPYNGTVQSRCHLALRNTPNLSSIANLRPYFDFKTAITTAISIVYLKLSLINSLNYSLFFRPLCLWSWRRLRAKPTACISSSEQLLMLLVLSTAGFVPVTIRAGGAAERVCSVLTQITSVTCRRKHPGRLA